MTKDKKASINIYTKEYKILIQKYNSPFFYTWFSTKLLSYHIYYHIHKTTNIKWNW